MYKATQIAAKFGEVNFDGLVGPTHNYAGLSPGNLASAKHADAVSHPKLAALQGLAKMKLLIDLGVPQGILPPHPRPDLNVLRAVGFKGSDAEVVNRVYHESPRLLAAVYGASAMWAANAATISPAVDAADGVMHVTPANLLTQFHRAIEPPVTAQYLKKILSGTHHDPLPSTDLFADEGAANHLRLCDDYGQPGLAIFVYGRDEISRPNRFPARQTKQACEAIARLHGLDQQRTMFLRQSPQAIDAGAFHNDVVAASNQDVLLVHRQAFADENAIEEIKNRFKAVVGRPPWVFVAEPEELSLADAVSTYIFNCQVVTLPDRSMAIIAPLECRDHRGVERYVERILSGNCPVKSIHYIDLRQSMHNGGGPACLRLRVVMPVEQVKGVVVGVEMIKSLADLVQRRYRDEISPADLADPALIQESLDTVDEMVGLLRMK